MYKAAIDEYKLREISYKNFGKLTALRKAHLEDVSIKITSNDTETNMKSFIDKSNYTPMNNSVVWDKTWFVIYFINCLHY
ncbi:21490_t:CDS:2 [Gigaspora rosea]|nr:21490_t:CDS:2 [Gigaspora rosea]